MKLLDVSLTTLSFVVNLAICSLAAQLYCRVIFAQNDGYAR